MRHAATRLALILLVCLIPTVGFAAEAPDKLTGELPGVLDRAAPEELIPVSVILADQLSGARLLSVAEGIEDPGQRRARMIAALKQHAQVTQQRILQLVSEAERAGRARSIQPLWIGNIVAAELTAGDIRRLARFQEVERINWAPKVDVFLERPVFMEPDRSFFDDPVEPAEVECGTDLMGAPRVWDELSNTGEGAVIAVIDSGVCWTHPDIANQVWVNPGEDLDGDGVVMDPDDENGIDDDGNGFVDDLVGWDFDQGDNRPSDDNSHGSHCAGTVAGDGTSGTQAGMAPDAEIMIIRVGLQFSDEPDVWNAMQYAAENGADAISMSLGWPHNQNPDRATWRTNCENTIELGTSMVIAAGNEGQGNEPDNVRTPGDVPRIISVGATDCNDNAASFSSRGPVTWQDVPEYGDHPYPPGLIKPDVSAPGVSTRSHNICSGYSTKSGTSMATPHVAGTVALMKSANPGLTHDDIKFILEDSSIDLGAPGRDNTYGTGRVDAYEAVLRSQTSDGLMAIKQQAASCQATMDLTVSDTDMRGSGSLAIELTSDSEPTPEIITLTETSATSGVFRGTVSTDGGAPSSDGLLQVAHGDTMTATYIDADDGNGGIDVPKIDTAAADCVGPLITDVHTNDISTSSATIRWTTDEISDSFVRYGELVPPTQEQSSAADVTDHAVTLTGLQECTIYYFEVASADPYENAEGDDNGGQYFFFETYGDFGNGPQPCHAGQIDVLATAYPCSSTAAIELVDLDLNVDSNVADSIMVEVSSTSETQPEAVLLTETGANTSVFSGSITLATGSATGDGVLQVSGGDVLTATYVDGDVGTGAPGISFDTAIIDCAGPAISNLHVTDITDQRMTVRFETDEPGDTVIEWGPTPALGQVWSSSSDVTTHSATLNQMDICQSFYLRVQSTDIHGNVAVSDLGGSAVPVHTWDIPGLYYRETFENGAGGWTLPGEWEIGTPQGQGGSSGGSDPTNAYNNSGVLGHDLSGQGGFGGDYEPDINETASSPMLDGSGWTNTKLLYRRQLRTHRDDSARLIVMFGGTGQIFFRSTGTTYNESSYQLVETDLSVFVDGKQGVQLQFVQVSDESIQYGGWNVDDIVFKDGSLPDFAACGGCAAEPSFGGATSAFDNDACGADGVTVSWEPVVSWGSGATGTYAVYRGETPDFTPGPGNLVASGLGGTSYNDAGAPTDRDLYYVVRAESDETCGSGPANNGAMDQNLARVHADETTSRPLPDAVDTLRLTMVNHAHVRLSWQSAGGAASYRIYRSESAADGFVLQDDVDGLLFEDLNQAGDARSYFYLVESANACGDEAP